MYWCKMDCISQDWTSNPAISGSPDPPHEPHNDVFTIYSERSYTRHVSVSGPDDGWDIIPLISGLQRHLVDLTRTLFNDPSIKLAENVTSALT